MHKHIKEFLSAETVNELKTWVFYLFNNGLLPQNKICTEGVRFGNNIATLNTKPPKIYFDVLEKIIKEVRSVIGDPSESASIGYAIMYHKDGAVIQTHVDSVQGKLPVYRCNILISKPTSGGIPTFDEVETEINEGDMLTFYGYTDLHGATMTKGKIDRILLSFGFDINKLGESV